MARKTNKADVRMETIFAHAVALEQTGRLKNTVYVVGKEIYILNSDRTILLQFALPKSSPVFEHPVSFKASDYDSNTFVEEDGQIKFVTTTAGLMKVKTCKTPEMMPEEAREIFQRFELKKKNTVTLNKAILGLLDNSLSHIEFSSEGKEFKIIQRNIYDGSVTEITREAAKGFGVKTIDDISVDFGPLGMRTTDFQALFSFNDEITFEFPVDSKCGFCLFAGRNFKMKGVMALCLYDEMGTIEPADDPVPKKKKKKRKKKKSE